MIQYLRIFLPAFFVVILNFAGQASASLQEPIVIEGIVTAKTDGEPLPGVNVFIKGTTTGTITGIDGSYKLQVPNIDAVIVFSFVGYRPVEEPVGQRQSINVVLEDDVQVLDDIVVTAVGIESNKRQLAYSIQTVNTDQMAQAREANLVSALSGKAAGVQVTSSSGSPGASASIRIRGNKSFAGRNEPLFVIDGVPVDNGSSGNGSAGVDVSNRAVDFSAMDIESMSILKGPQATVLYGVRAANGAVIITTKRGKKGTPVITVNSSYAMDEVNKLPARQTLYAQGAPEGTYVYKGPETGTTSSWGPLISELEFANETPYPYDQNGKLVPVGTGSGIPARYYDPYKAFFIKGHTFDNSVSVSGGTDGAKYYFSAGKLYQSGVIPTQDFQRLSVKSNIDVTLSEKFSLAMGAQFTNSGGNRIQRGSNVSGAMTGIFRNASTFDIGNGKTGNDASDDPTTYLQENGEQRTMAYSTNNKNATYDNPFFTINRNPWKDNVNRFVSNIGFSYKALPWLTTSYKLGLDYFTDTRNSAFDLNSASEPFGSIAQSVRSNADLNSDFLVLINKDFGTDFEFSGTLGQNYFSTNFEVQSSSGTGISVPGFYNIDNTSVIQSSRSITRRKVFGLFGEAKVVYKGYLILNVSGRNDWSSTLPKGKNSFFYPAASVGFVLTDMVDINSKILSYVKFRGSAGQTGNDAPTYRTESYFISASAGGDPVVSSNSFPLFGIAAFEKSSLLGNNELRAELTTSYEAGTDLKFFGGKLGFDFTYYYSKSADQIVSVQISAASGPLSYVTNAGSMINEGVELALNATPIESNNFGWDVNLNFTRNRNRVTNIPLGVDDLTLSAFSAVSSKLIEGEPFGILSGSRYRRNADGRLLIGSDGFPIIDETQGIIGDPNPDWLMGFTNTFRYKDFSLSFLWDVRKGGDLWNGTRSVMNYLGVSKETGEQRTIENFVFDGVTIDGQENTIPVSFANPAGELSDIYWRKAGLLGVAESVIEDGSWLRLRNVSLSYNLKTLKVGNFISGAKLTFYARNLLLFTEYTGIDPETNLRGASSDAGWDYFNMPNTRSYGATLQFTFK